MSILKSKSQDLNLGFTVTLDGPAASGKGLIGVMLAEFFSLEYFQSGALYRGVAHLCLRNQIDPQDFNSISDILGNIDLVEYIKDKDLSLEEIGITASKVAVIPDLRFILNEYQRNIIQSVPRIIMEGRDIGTVIAPQADLKIFLTASSEVRAARRFKQLRSLDNECILEQVLRDMIERDLRDSARDSAPLKVPQDALVIDTSDLEPAEVIRTINEFILKQ
jgi:cytidylate kinase